MDFKKLGEDLGLDEDEFIELAELFVETAPQDLQRLTEAGETNSPSLAAEAAHSLKGSSGNLGFAEISEIAGHAEKSYRNGEMDGLEETVLLLRRKIDELAGLL